MDFHICANTVYFVKTNVTMIFQVDGMYVNEKKNIMNS